MATYQKNQETLLPEKEDLNLTCAFYIWGLLQPTYISELRHFLVKNYSVRSRNVLLNWQENHFVRKL